MRGSRWSHDGRTVVDQRDREELRFGSVAQEKARVRPILPDSRHPEKLVHESSNNAKSRDSKLGTPVARPPCEVPCSLAIKVTHPVGIARPAYRTHREVVQ
jgi:hypothetical protein